MKKNIKHNWRRLDNSGKIFPIATNKKNSVIFRFSILLTERINKDILEEAANITINKYKSFKIKLKAGFFWYYFEQNEKRVKVEKENDYPCKYINAKDNNDYLFKITYFKKKINIDILHLMTDGNSGLTFFKEIVYTYLELLHPNLSDNTNSLNIIPENLSTEDSYLEHNAKPLTKQQDKKVLAHQIKGTLIKLDGISAIHYIIDLPKLKIEAQKYNATITQYLTALLIYAIYLETHTKNNHKPITICIPVNLRFFFPSNTLSNFFSHINTSVNMNIATGDILTYIISYVKKDFKEKLTKEEMQKSIYSNVKIGDNFGIKILPLFFKKIFTGFVYTQIRKDTVTMTHSSLGKIEIEDKYKQYINYFLVLLSPEKIEKIKCSSCTYDNNLTVSFTSILNNNKIEKRFYNLLLERNIPTKIESNGVLNDIS